MRSEKPHADEPDNSSVIPLTGKKVEEYLNPQRELTDEQLGRLFEMGNNVYDIIHLEDDTQDRYLVEKHAGIQDLSYFGVGSLKELEECLGEKFIAGVFVVDGRFPKEQGGSVDFNAPEAVGMIQKHYPGANIVAYSSHPGVDELQGVIPISKATLPKELVERIREMIDED